MARFTRFVIRHRQPILLDAAVVRALLVPATMKLLGHWNWFLPDGVHRAFRLPAPARPPMSPGRAKA